MNVTKTFTFQDGSVLKIIQDDDPQHPREDDNNGTMVCFHKRYTLGDEADGINGHSYKSSDFSGYSDLKTQIQKDHDVVVILPLYLFDHSGLSLATDDTHFRMADRHGWDWGQIGWIFATRENLKKMGHPDDVDPEKVATWLRGEVDTYHRFLSGDVYGFVLHNPPCKECGGEGEESDSCWGFYGSNPTENGSSDHRDE